ncbi:MAG TPA: thiol reductant ABC exporter subunit CydD [Solirubrobacteraceae bacterium]|jgi:thiol reductant ABC exporter CydD subunit|nr:thiol reductant ABC exporter subunit CydD [Solirubrobacteraceae bacterium]
MAPPVDRRLLGESAPAKTHLVVAGALGTLSAVLIVAQAALLAYVIDRAAMRRATLGALEGELLALAAVLCARALIDGGFELSGRWGAARIMSELRGRLAGRLLLENPEQRPSGARTGELANTAVQGVEALEAYFAGYLPQLVLATVVPLAVIVWVTGADPVAAGILALTVPLLVLFMVLIGRGARAQAQARWRTLGLLGAHFLDVVQGLATLRAYNREDAQERTLAQVGERYRGETMATLGTAFMSALVLELCAMIGTALVAATIGVQLVDGALGLQAGLTVLLLAPELYGPLRLVGQQFHASADAATASARIFQTLDSPCALHHAAGALRPPSPALSPVRFEAVSFRYPGRAEPALERLELELRAGAITAIVGPSGAGKSTLARLLMRLADPTAGRIACGGVDLRELDLEAWRSQIAWVPQRPTLFSGTIAENIALCRPDASAAEIRAAAVAAGAGDFVAALPQGLRTPVGDGARRLSAGQAQRVALARAFLADRPLLLLDEPTAHLDEASARTISETVARLAHGRTALLIAHDPLLTELADHVHALGVGQPETSESVLARAPGAAARLVGA